MIEWEDAKGDLEYDGPVEMVPSDLIICKDVGWIVKKTKKTIVLAQSISFEDETARCLTIIPRKNIVRVLEMVPKELESGQNEPKSALSGAREVPEGQE